MDHSILSQVDASIISLILFFLMLLTIAFGNIMRKKILGAEDGDTKGGVNSLLGALFGLWSFTLAFTFGQSGTRFENVRGLIVDEANALRTVIIRADLFPDSARHAYRSELSKYLEERIAYYDNATDEAKFNENRKELSKTSRAIWAITVGQSKDPTTTNIAAPMALSLTTLFDLGIKREALLNAGIPHPISYMLITLALTICFVGGFTTSAIKRKEWIVIAVFSFLASLILYITIDLARPMQGLIRPDAGQATMVDLRKLF